MSATENAKAMSRTNLLQRAFWITMCVGHVPALRALTGEDAQWTRGAAVLLTQTFFLLKIFDVPWLRIPNDRRTRMALIAGFVLLHARVFECTLAHTIDTPTAWYTLTLGTGLASIAVLFVRRRRLLDQTAWRAARHCARNWVEHFIAAARDAFLPPRFLLHHRSFSLNRPPPVCA